MQKTTTVKKNDIKQDWHLIDAKGKVLGQLATEIAVILTGKDKPTFSTHINVGDYVVVVNAKDVVVTGNKREGKIYYWHTGYPGGIRSETFSKLMERKPTEALRRAVKGMLPKNKLQKHRMRNLFIYEGSEHPHVAQVN